MHSKVRISKRLLNFKKQFLLFLHSPFISLFHAEFYRVNSRSRLSAVIFPPEVYIYIYIQKIKNKIGGISYTHSPTTRQNTLVVGPLRHCKEKKNHLENEKNHVKANSCVE